MGCCCGKKSTADDDKSASENPKQKSSSSAKRKKGGDKDEPGLSGVTEYKFQSSKDDWQLQEPKKAIQPDAVQKLEKNADLEKPLQSASANQVSNVILFDSKTGSEIYKKIKQNPEILKPGSSARKIEMAKSSTINTGGSSTAGKTTESKEVTQASESRGGSGEGKTSSNPKLRTEFFKTTVDGVEKLAAVFVSDEPVNQEDLQFAMSGFMDNLQIELPAVFNKKDILKPPPTVAFVSDTGRPLKLLPKVPRREVVRQTTTKIDYGERFNKLFGKYFAPGPGHITLPHSSNIDDLPGFSQVKPGWLNINGVFYFIILIERSEGTKYLNRLRANPATAQLSDETQGDFFQCEYAGLEMLGLRLFHAKNSIQKIDKSQRVLLMDHMNDINNVAIHTDYDYKEDPYDIVKCCNRLELAEEVKREYLLVSAY